MICSLPVARKLSEGCQHKWIAEVVCCGVERSLWDCAGQSWTEGHQGKCNHTLIPWTKGGYIENSRPKGRVPFSWSSLAVFFQQLILTKPNIELSGLPWLLSDEEPACQFRRRGFDPWVRKIPWRRKWQPIPVFLPKKFHGQSGLVNYSPWGCKRVRYDLATSTT